MAFLDLSTISSTIKDIEIEDITNDENTGVFDKLMASVNEHILLQYENNRITGTDYATVYLGSIQSVLQQSIQFALQEQLSEAQVVSAYKDADLKDEQLKTAYTDRVLKDKQTAKLGLDNVMKQSETSRDAGDDFVYTPRYEKGTG